MWGFLFQKYKISSFISNLLPWGVNLFSKLSRSQTHPGYESPGLHHQQRGSDPEFTQDDII